MKYEINKSKIIIKNNKEFDPQHILECGQVFSYIKNKNGYTVYSADKKAIIQENDNGYSIETKDINYFINYFDLNNNYENIKNDLIEKYPFLNDAIIFGNGIRILKQDIFETIISFVVSANNNIKRIQKILFGIREKFGTNMGDYYSFPTLNQLLSAQVEDFKNLGAGYRAPYLYKICRQLENVDLNEMSKLPTKRLNETLLTYMGVGQKVADCIMLFAFSKQDVFPVDTWIEKVYCTYFCEEHNRTIIRKELLNTFQQESGYAQQYLFYFQRANKM